jgi:hypothetical protein
MSEKAIRKIYYNILNGSVKIIRQPRSLQALGSTSVTETRMSHAEYVQGMLRILRSRKRLRQEVGRMLIETKIDLLLKGIDGTDSVKSR